MKFIYFVSVVFCIGLDQVYSDNSSARRSRVRNREYASVPVVIVYDDSANSNKDVVSSTEGKLAIPSTTEATKEQSSKTIDKINTIEIASDKILLPDVPIVPKDLNKVQRSDRRNRYEIPVAVVYDSVTETHTRQKLEAVTDSDNPVTVRNIRQRGRKRYRDQQDISVQQSDKEVKITARVLKEDIINPIHSNSLLNDTVKTKTVVRRRRPSKEGLTVVESTRRSIADEPVVTEKILKVSENIASHIKEPVIYENVKSNPTESVIETTTSLIDESLQDEQVLNSQNPIIQEKKPVFLRRRLSKQHLNVVETTQRSVQNKLTVTEKILNVIEKAKPVINENVKSNSVIEVTTSLIDESLQDEQILGSSLKNYPIVLDEKIDKFQQNTITRSQVTPITNPQTFFKYSTKPAVEVTTSSIDESLQDEQIIGSTPKNESIISEEKADKIQKRTRTRDPVTPTVKQNIWYPTKPVTEITTPAIYESSVSLQDEQIFTSPRNDPMTLKDKPDKDQRRTRIRGPVVPIVNSQNFVYQNGEFHYR